MRTDGEGTPGCPGRQHAENKRGYLVKHIKRNARTTHLFTCNTLLKLPPLVTAAQPASLDNGRARPFYNQHVAQLQGPARTFGAITPINAPPRTLEPDTYLHSTMRLWLPIAPVARSLRDAPLAPRDSGYQSLLRLLSSKTATRPCGLERSHRETTAPRISNKERGDLPQPQAPHACQPLLHMHAATLQHASRHDKLSSHGWALSKR